MFKKVTVSSTQGDNGSTASATATATAPTSAEARVGCRRATSARRNVFRVALVPAAGGLLVATGLSPAPASADVGNVFDISGLRATPLHVASGSCRNVAVFATTDAAWDYQAIDVEADVWRGDTYLGTASLSREGQSERLSGSYFYCPSLDDVGVFRLGESQVSWSKHDSDFSYYDSGSFTDTSTGSAVIKQSTRMTLTGTRAGSVRNFRAAGSYFALGTDAWTRFPSGVRLSLQRQSLRSTTWSFVRSASTNSRGVAAFRTSARTLYRYRVVFAGTRYSWPVTSQAVAK